MIYFNYAVNTCGEDLQLFYSRFLSSKVSAALSMANPKYLAGMSGIELDETVDQADVLQSVFLLVFSLYSVLGKTVYDHT